LLSDQFLQFTAREKAGIRFPVLVRAASGVVALARTRRWGGGDIGFVQLKSFAALAACSTRRRFSITQTGEKRQDTTREASTVSGSYFWVTAIRWERERPVARLWSRGPVIRPGASRFVNGHMLDVIGAGGWIRRSRIFGEVTAKQTT